ncbi:nucleotidyl transferase AbiEii/AbiGii toxin family protein [Pedobacter sp. Leaf194]|uniref:nucleotidyl transferase AbiEii/AbiGii toxin family protein n=1 Tax=Pedobacter sp. Leaf194 TaxID=1736297 RepID=UPI000702DBC3|nr:nucleotidyl transferase AbiEii/AbiGii toxin family protein [Pedobacter sp. Leaf194]KQS36188.1 hypothetical protein ASG14_12205 [Pedobacter sp. Leaf194]
MSKKEEYSQQVRLLVRLLPIIDKEACFALKGGTAINLFYRPFPRLSVDIDLLYLPSEDRETSITNIKAAFARIITDIKETIKGARVQNTTDYNICRSFGLVNLVRNPVVSFPRNRWSV